MQKNFSSSQCIDRSHLSLYFATLQFKLKVLLVLQDTMNTPYISGSE